MKNNSVQMKSVQFKINHIFFRMLKIFLISLCYRDERYIMITSHLGQREGPEAKGVSERLISL